MTTKQKLFWVLVPSVVLTSLGGLAMIPKAGLSQDIGGIILLPGWMLSVMISGNPHQGLGGPAGVLAIAIGSILAWSFISGLLLCIVVPLRRAWRHFRV